MKDSLTTKTIRFLGKVILFLARTIEILSTMLKFTIFVIFFVGLFMGCTIGIVDLFYPLGHMEIPFWLNILALVIGVGSIWLASDKLRAEDREYKKKMNELRNNTWLDE